MVFSEQDVENHWTHFPGLTIDWYSIDRNGNVALLLSGMGAPIPSNLVAESCKLKSICQELETLPATKSPIVGLSDFFKRWKAHPQYLKEFEIGVNYLVQLGKKGVFCFDENPDDGRYIRIIAPKTPIKVMELSEDIRALLANFSLDCDFVESERLI